MEQALQAEQEDVHYHQQALHESIAQQAGNNVAEGEEEGLIQSSPLSLKEQKELFVTGHEGSTAWEVLLVCSAASIGIWLFQSIRKLQQHLEERRQLERKHRGYSNNNKNTNAPTISRQTSTKVAVITEAVVLWLPYILCQTHWLYPWGVILLWAEVQVSLLIYIYFWSLQRLAVIEQERKHRIKNKKKNAAHAQTRQSTATPSQTQSNIIADNMNNLSTVDEDLEEEDVEELMEREEASLMKDIMTVYRSSMLYMTFVAILAVDFHIFPRRFAKTEVSGYGLMDLGAASFVVAAGLVSPRARLPQELLRQRLSFGKRDAARILPLLALGFIRLATNKGLEYQEHVSEYGVHWNFFFTLAIVTPLGSILPGRPNWILPILLLGSYQYALLIYGWQGYIENAPRDHCVLPDEGFSAAKTLIDTNPYLNKLCSLVTANREGVFGCIGYLSLYLFGECIAYSFLWTYQKKSLFGRQSSLWILTACLWMVLYGLKEHLNIPVSRRSTNAPFCVWTLAHNLILLTGIRAAMYLYDHQQLRQLALARNKEDSNFVQRPRVPVVFQAVNRHGFLAFLVANVLTGLTNLSINTLEVSDPLALLILFVYIGAVGGFSLALHHLLKSDESKKRGSGKDATTAVDSKKQKEE